MKDVIKVKNLDFHHPDSKFLLEVIGNSQQVTLSNLAFRDATGEEAFLDEKCRVNVNNPNPNLWDAKYCFAPILLGSTLDAEDPARGLTLDRLDLLSRKAVLVEVRKTERLTVSRSLFDGGKVYGILFQAAFSHANSTFSENRFQHSGTAALNLFNSTNSVVRGNKFTDNHIDPQFGYCAGGGTVPSCEGGTLRFYPGGQLYVADAAVTDKDGFRHEYGNHFVHIFENEISMTPAYLGHQSTVGLEIMNGVAGEITDVLVENNFIHDISRQAIAVHNDRGGHARQKRIVIRNNRLYDNFRDFKSLSKFAKTKVMYVQMEVGPNFGSQPHPNVDIDGNHLKDGAEAEIVGSFAGTPSTCQLDPSTRYCSIELHWSAEGFPAGSRPTIRVNGKIMAKYSEKGAAGTIAIPWIGLKNANFTLHLDDADPNPVAAINVVGEAK